jgi:hypothetical protein
MCYSPAPDRPRTPVALLKTEAEPERRQTNGLRIVVSGAERVNSLAVQDQNPTRRRMIGGARRNHERVPGRFGAHAVVKRFCVAIVVRRIARLDSSPESQFDQLRCYFPPFMVGRGLPFPGCFVVSMLKNLSRFVSASRPENSRRIWVGGGGESRRRRRRHVFNAGIRQRGVREKFVDAGLDPELSSASLSAQTIAIAPQTH